MVSGVGGDKMGQYTRVSLADDSNHLRKEIRRSFQFVPQLDRIWKGVTEQEVNPHFCLKVNNLSGGRYAYVEKVDLV